MRAPDISYVTDIWFGCGAVREVPALLAGFACRRPLVVTDAGLEALGLVERLGLPERVMYAGTQTNPSETHLKEALERFWDNACDSVVALGGGASLDLAKLVAMMTVHAPPLAQYAILNQGGARIRAPAPPLIAVPTTAGSGSEVGRAALLRLDSGRKLGFLSPFLLPRAAVCDPQLTLSMPPPLTAATGMDAISHCVEAYLSTRVNAVADAIALEGLAAAADVPDAFARLVEELGLPRRLRELGVPREALATLAPQAVEDHCTATNPRALGEPEARQLYEEAW